MKRISALLVLALSACGETKLQSIPAHPQMTVLSSELDFGQLYLGETRQLLLPVVNDGTADLELADVLAEGSPTQEFTWTTFPRTLSPGEEVDIPFRYAPTNGGNDHELV